MPGHFLANARGQNQPPPPPSRGNESPSDVRSVAGRCPFAKLLCLSVFRFNPVKGPSPRRYRVCGPHQPLDRLSTPEKEQLSISYKKVWAQCGLFSPPCAFWSSWQAYVSDLYFEAIKGALSVLARNLFMSKSCDLVTGNKRSSLAIIFADSL